MTQKSSYGSAPPPPPQRGGGIYAWAQEFYNWAKKTQAIPGAGLLSRQTQAGRVFNAIRGEDSKPPPWTISQVSGLTIRMQRGKTWFRDRASSDLVKLFETPISGTEEDPVDSITLSDNTTKEIYLEIYLEVGGDQVYRWSLHSDPGTPNDSPLFVDTGSSVPESTFDATNLYNSADDPLTPEIQRIPIATVVTASGEVTSITQHLSGILPLSYDASLPEVLAVAQVGDLYYGIADNKIAPLDIGAAGSVLRTADGTAPSWLPIGTEGQYLIVESGQPVWTTLNKTTLNVVTSIRDNAGTIEYKTTEITVFSKGDEGDWIST